MFKREICPPLEIINIHSFSQGVFKSNLTVNSTCSLSLRFNSDSRFITGNQTFSVKTGDICFIPSDLEYIRECTKDNVIVISFDCFYKDFSEISIFSPNKLEKYFDLFNEILEKWIKKESGFKAECTSLLYKTISMIQQDINKKEMRSLPKALADSVAIINENFSDPDLSIAYLAKESFVSEGHLRHLFSKHFNTSPQKYIRDVRMKRALSMMESLAYSVKEIAIKCGFSDCSYFSYVFRKMYGISPTKYIEEKIKNIPM